MTRSPQRLIPNFILPLLLAIGCGNENSPTSGPVTTSAQQLTIESVEPSTWPTRGLVTLRLTGTGFLQGAQVRIGSCDKFSAKVVTPQLLEVTLPACPGAFGLVPIEVENPDMNKTVRSDLFRHTASVVDFEFPYFLGTRLPKESFGSYTKKLATDLDQDGYVDLIIAGGNGTIDRPGELLYIKGTPAGGFQEPRSLTRDLTQYGYYDLAVGDLDGDGFRDIAVTCEKTIRIFWGKSGTTISGSFTDIPVETKFEIQITDIDDTKTNELITRTEQSIMRYKCNSSRICSENWKYDDIDLMSSELIEDLDSDGRKEAILVTCQFRTTPPTCTMLVFYSATAAPWERHTASPTSARLRRLFVRARVGLSKTIVTIEDAPLLAYAIQEYRIDKSDFALSPLKPSPVIADQIHGSTSIEMRPDGTMLSHETLSSVGELFRLEDDLKLTLLQNFPVFGSRADQIDFDVDQNDIKSNIWNWSEQPFGIFAYPLDMNNTDRPVHAQYSINWNQKGRIVPFDFDGDQQDEILSFDGPNISISRVNVQEHQFLRERASISLIGADVRSVAPWGDSGAQTGRLVAITTPRCGRDTNKLNPQLRLLDIRKDGGMSLAGTWEMEAIDLCSIIAYRGKYSTAIGDFDGDGGNDVIVFALNVQKFSYMAGQGTFSGGAKLYPLNQDPVADIMTIDINHDRISDLLYFGNGLIFVAVGPTKRNMNGSEKFSSVWRATAPILRDPSHSALATVVVRDVNGDGNDDLVVTELYDEDRASTKKWYLHVGLGNGKDADFSWLGELETGGPLMSIVDLDGDGQMDYLINAADSIRVVRGSALGISSWKRFPIGDVTQGIVGRFARDGRADLLLKGQALSLHRNISQ